MEAIHKKAIQKSRIDIVRDMDLSELEDRLLEKDIFTKNLIEQIKVGLLNINNNKYIFSF